MLGFTLVAPDGRILRADHNFSSLLMTRTDDLVGRNIRDITHPDDRSDTQAGMQALREGLPTFTIGKRYFRSDGKIIWARSTAAHVGLKSGHSFVSGVIEPIVADASLAHSRKDRREIFEALNRWSDAITNKITTESVVRRGRSGNF